MYSNNSRRLKAAADLEELAIELKTIVQELREDATPNLDYAYARVYDFRTRLGHVVATLGSGMPVLLYKLQKKLKQREQTAP